MMNLKRPLPLSQLFLFPDLPANSHIFYAPPPEPILHPWNDQIFQPTFYSTGPHNDFLPRTSPPHIISPAPRIYFFTSLHPPCSDYFHISPLVY